MIFKLAAITLFAGASVSYFKYFRDVKTGSADHQQFIAVDETIWQHARPDLADLRLYAGQSEVPYAIAVERGSSQTERRDVRVLQPARVSGKTQFFLDMAGLTEYDRIELKLKTINFVAKVRTEGADDLHARTWATLGNGILYDLSDDRLGSNTTLRLPLTAYKYLRVTTEGPVKPGDIEGAVANVREEEKVIWRTIDSQAKQQQQGKDTVFIFTVPRNVPLERLAFSIDPAQPNFKREVELQNDRGSVPLGSGEISRGAHGALRAED